MQGIHFAMPYLTQGNQEAEGTVVPNQITAKGKHVIIIGGGDTGSDCLGTALRQGAASVTTLAIGVQAAGGARREEPAVADAPAAVRGVELARGGRRARRSSRPPSSSLATRTTT